MELYSGRKILILAGKPIGSLDIVKYAKERGAYTIVTDNLSVLDSPAKVIADEYWDISTADIDLLCGKIKENNIDAVFTGVHEFNIWKALEVCEVLNFPFYASKKQMTATSVKDSYKKLFKDHRVPVIDEFILEKDNFEGYLKDVEYPVLIKPVDGSGGYGISICYTENELKLGYEKAMSFSKNKRVLVEKYISAEEVTIFYIVQNGNIMLSAMADRHTGNGRKYVIPLPVLYTFPSIYLSKFIDDLNNKLIKVFESLELRDGMLFIQAFVDNGEFKPYDIGYRLTGTQEYHILEELCGYNPLKMLVDYSFTRKFGNEDLRNSVDPFFKGNHACNITFLIKPCVIGKFVGLEDIENMKGVIKVIKNHEIGHEIFSSAVGTLNQVGLRVLAVSDSREALKQLIEVIVNKVDIESASGESVILPFFKIENL